MRQSAGQAVCLGFAAQPRSLWRETLQAREQPPAAARTRRCIARAAVGAGLVICGLRWPRHARAGRSNWVLQWSARKRVSRRALNMARAPTEHGVGRLSAFECRLLIKGVFL